MTIAKYQEIDLMMMPVGSCFGLKGLYFFFDFNA
jgi:hypothetical protein